MSTPAAPYRPPVFGPGFPVRVRKVGAPLAVIILLGTLTGLIVILLTAVNPVGTAIGFVLSSVAMTVVVAAYLWLDRWEPEPPRLLVLAFIWGASVAVVMSVFLSLVFDAVVNADAAAGGEIAFSSVVIGAPVIEEFAKGLFLLIMLTGRRRHELNSLTDCLVYAGLVGAGFAWLEDILYISGGQSLGDALVTAAMRLIMAPFAHSLFTTMFGIGVWFALQRRSVPAKAGCVLLGYAAAVLMHGLWNGSSFLGLVAYFAVYVLWMVPIFALVIVLAVSSRRREQRVVAAKLPGLVSDGLITANEATWLGSMSTRKLAIAEAGRVGGKPAAKSLKAFAAQVVELAFVRDRIDRGFGDARVAALHDDEIHRVAARRANAPMLHWMSGYRASN